MSKFDQHFSPGCRSDFFARLAFERRNANFWCEMRARRKKQGDQEARHENISCAHVRDTESARDESAAFLTPRCADRPAAGDSTESGSRDNWGSRWAQPTFALNVNYAPANLLVLLVLSLSFCGTDSLAVPISPARWRTRQGSMDEAAGRPSAAADFSPLMPTRRTPPKNAHAALQKTLVAEVLPGMQTDTL